MATGKAPRKKIRKRRKEKTIRKRRKEKTIRKRRKEKTIRATTKNIIQISDPAHLQLEQAVPVRTGRGSGDDKPPVLAGLVVHQAAQTKEAAADGEQERAGGIRDACSICGSRSHTEYFCAYNYMDGCFSTRACREQCSSSSPGRHAMAAQDSLRRFVRVTNVPSSLGDRGLCWLFQRFGPLRKCVVSRAGPDGGAGFGFVTFHNRGDAEEAVDELNGHRVGDRRLRVDWAYPRAHHA